MKRFFAIAVVAVMLALTVVPAGAVVTIEKADAPYGVVYSIYDDGYSERVSISCLLTDNLSAITKMSEAESIKKYGIKNIYAYIQADYRIDGGNWHAEDTWETTPSAAPYSCQIMPGETVRSFELLYLANETALKDAGDLAKIEEKTDANGNHRRVFDLDSHKLEFRLRVSLGFTNDTNMVVTSDWTEPVTVKRGSNFGKAPETIDAPVISNPRVEKMPSNDCPYLTFYMKIPETVKKAEAWFSAMVPTYIGASCYLDKGDGKWVETQLTSPSTSTYSNEDKIVYLTATDLEDEGTVRLKVQYIVYLGDKALYSKDSEILTFDTPRWVEGKGIMHAKCKVCGVCRPIFGICMFIWLSILLLAAVVAIVPIKMHRDKVKARKALEEEERKRREEEERAAKKAASKKRR